MAVEKYVAPTYSLNAPTTIGNWAAREKQFGPVYFTFSVPEDFGQLQAVRLVILGKPWPNNFRFTLKGNYGSSNEQYTAPANPANQLGPTNYTSPGFLANEIEEIDVTSIIPNPADLAPGEDNITLVVQHLNYSAYIVGLRFIYTGEWEVRPGMILLWSGAIANIPFGWVLCNGFNGTPDLRDQFVRGAGGAFNPDDTGGQNTHNHAMPHTHTFAVPNHTHTVDPPNTASTSNGRHNHTATTGSSGAHRHTGRTGPEILTGANGRGLTPVWPGDHEHRFTTNTAGAHTHPVTVGFDGNHSHFVNIGPFPSGAAGAFGASTGQPNPGNTAIQNNVPEFYALAYIMKL